MGRREADDLDRPPPLTTAALALPRRTARDTQRAVALAFVGWSIVLVAVAPFLGVLAGPGVALAGLGALGYVGVNLAPELRPAGLVGLVGLLLAILLLT